MLRSILGLFFVALAGGISGCGAAPAVVADSPAGQDVGANVECRSHADCDDGLFCNGREQCRGVTCEDGARPCGNGACNEAGNLCVADEPEPDCTTDSQCQDGTFCNGREECISGTCYLGDRPCGNDACDEARNECPPDEVPLQCDAGYSRAANEPEVCCPNGFPYVAIDGYCYESLRQVVSYARCQERGFTSAATDTFAQAMLGIIEDFGLTRLDLLQINSDACRETCLRGNDQSCFSRCINCYSAIVAALLDG